MTIQLFEVGGSIRDEMLGFQNKDRDYVAVCEGGWRELLTWSNDAMDKVFLVTPAYFTIRGMVDGEVMDVVLARKDGAYSDGRHPDEVEPGTLEDDLARRDFTMNAIARSVWTGKVIDPFNGQEDIKNKLIRCVGNSAHRIEEDSLRILRALRFFVTKGLTLSEDLSKMLYRNRLVQDGVVQEPSYAGLKVTDLLESVSRERVREELHKMFKHDSLSAARTLFGSMVHQELQEEILGNDIWLRPSMEKR